MVLMMQIHANRLIADYSSSCDQGRIERCKMVENAKVVLPHFLLRLIPLFHGECFRVESQIMFARSIKLNLTTNSKEQYRDGTCRTREKRV